MKGNMMGEGMAVTSVIAAIMQWAPPVVALLGAVWWIMKIIIEWPNLKEAIRKRKSPD